MKKKKRFTAILTASLMLSASVPDYCQIMPKMSITADAVNKSVDIIDLQTYEVLDSTNTTDTATSGDFDDIHWELDSKGTLRISGTGLMPGTDYQSPWNDIKEKVKNIIIEDGVTSIGGYAFYDFTNLEAVLISESVTSIGKYAFANCSKLQVADIPEGIEVIREGTFINCKKLEALFFPASLKTIETDAFKNDLSIGAIYHGSDATLETLTKKIKFYSGNESITNTGAITVYQFNRMRYNGIEKKFYGKCGETAFFEFKDGFFRMYGTGDTWSYDPFIPWGAILNEIETVVVENGITSIGRMSFSGCENLTSVTLPDTLTTIVEFAFSGCSSLSSITIPASVTYISFASFASFDGGSLKDIYYEGSESNWNNIIFHEFYDYELMTDAEIHFNIDGESKSENDSVTTSGKCGENVSWEFFDGTLTIKGNGEMEDYCDSNMLPTPKNSPWYKYSDEIKKVQIENGITSIGIGTMMNFPNLVDVEIADTVTYIQRWAFSNCPSLKSIVFPAGVEYIDRESFGNCDRLTKITIMNNKIYIGNWCFGSCGNLDVYFNGTEEEWKETFNAMANSTLATAKFHSLSIQEDERNMLLSMDDVWGFKNSSEILTLKHYHKFFQLAFAAFLYNAGVTVDNDGKINLPGSTGVCAGMATSAISASVYNSPYPETFQLPDGSYAKCLHDVTDKSSNSLFYSADDLIKYAQVYNLTPFMAIEQKLHKNDLDKLYSSVYDSVYNEKEIVEIQIEGDFGGRMSGHALVAMGIGNDSAEETEIIVYDCNSPNAPQIFNLYKTENKYTSWSYEPDYYNNWSLGTGKAWASITFTTPGNDFAKDMFSDSEEILMYAQYKLISIKNDDVTVDINSKKSKLNESDEAYKITSYSDIDNVNNSSDSMYWVESDSDITFNNVSSDNEIGIADSYESVCINSPDKSDVKIFVSNDNDDYVYFDNIQNENEFSVDFCSYENSSDDEIVEEIYRISGSTSNSMKITNYNDSIIVNGADEFTVTIINNDNLTDSISVKSDNNSIKINKNDDFTLSYSINNNDDITISSSRTWGNILKVLALILVTGTGVVFLIKYKRKN